MHLRQTITERCQHPRLRRFVAVVGLLAIHAGLLAYSATTHSPTMNEPGHLVAGLSYWEFGRFDLNILAYAEFVTPDAIVSASLSDKVTIDCPTWDTQIQISLASTVNLVATRVDPVTAAESSLSELLDVRVVTVSR